MRRPAAGALGVLSVDASSEARSERRRRRSTAFKTRVRATSATGLGPSFRRRRHRRHRSPTFLALPPAFAGRATFLFDERLPHEQSYYTMSYAPRDEHDQQRDLDNPRFRGAERWGNATPWLHPSVSSRSDQSVVLADVDLPRRKRRCDPCRRDPRSAQSSSATKESALSATQRQWSWLPFGIR